MFVGAVAAVALSGSSGPPADRFEVDYPSNPGYGRADAPGGAFVDLSAGAFRTCGVRAGGEIECWGDDYGEAPRGRFVSVDVWDSYGVGNACAVAVDASLVCWGAYRGGQRLRTRGRGDGVGGDQTPAGEFAAVSVAGWFSCGLRTDGSAVCWNHIPGNLNRPGNALDVPEGPFVEVHAGVPPCGLRPSGEFVCWSASANDVVRQEYSHENSFWHERLVAVSPGWGLTDDYFRGPPWEFPYDYVCGIRPDSTLACSTYYGDHGDPRDEYVQVDRTAGPLCALRADRSIACWNLTNVRSWDELSDPPPGEFTDIAVGAHHACAIRVDGTVACWGENSDKPLPDPCPEGWCPLE